MGSTYGWRTLLSGTLLRARPVAAAFPETLRALAAAGHEVGVHGYDHARWQDRLPRLRADDVADEVRRATAVLREILGEAPHGFAAPGWRCTPASLAAVDVAGFAYRSDTRGTSPYRPAANGHVFALPEIPTTLPTLDELYGRPHRRPIELAGQYRDLVRPGVLNVHTIHAEIEGGPHLGTLDVLLTRLRDAVRFVRLRDAAAALDPATLPVCQVREGRIAGRAMPVALQMDAPAVARA